MIFLKADYFGQDGPIGCHDFAVIANRCRQGAGQHSRGTAKFSGLAITRSV